MKRTHGFTLVEILVSMTIFTMAVGAIMSVFLSVNRSMYGLSDSIDLNARTRIVQERILLDVRGIKSVASIATQTFTATYVDFANPADTALTITYTLAAGKLTRSVDGATPTVVMSDLVTEPTAGAYSQFEFTNRSGVGTSSATEVRAIRFALVPQATARQRAGLVTGRNDPFASALIQLRNVKG
jgi:prepilin-type N-terminal cleavage/methylation domain-containing protein